MAAGGGREVREGTREQESGCVRVRRESKRCEAKRGMKRKEEQNLRMEGAAAPDAPDAPLRLAAAPPFPHLGEGGGREESFSYSYN